MRTSYVTSLLVVTFSMLLVSHSVSAAYTPHVGYLLHCGGCHLPDGSGNPPHVPSLQNELGKIVALRGGRDYIVRVPGASQTPVSDAELAEILNWVLENFNSKNLPANYQPLSGEEVSRSRKNILSDPLKHRARLWKQYEK